MRKGILIDPHTNFCIEREVTYDDSKRVDDMYYRVDGKDLIPIAYIYPVENKDKVLEALAELREAKKTFEDIQAKIFYRVLPTLR